LFIVYARRLKRKKEKQQQKSWRLRLPWWLWHRDDSLLLEGTYYASIDQVWSDVEKAPYDDPGLFDALRRTTGRTPTFIPRRGAKEEEKGGLGGDLRNNNNNERCCRRYAEETVRLRMDQGMRRVSQAFDVASDAAASSSSASSSRGGSVLPARRKKMPRSGFGPR
jgi:hypothetical protein